MAYSLLGIDHWNVVAATTQRGFFNYLLQNNPPGKIPPILPEDLVFNFFIDLVESKAGSAIDSESFKPYVDLFQAHPPFYNRLEQEANTILQICIASGKWQSALLLLKNGFVNHCDAKEELSHALTLALENCLENKWDIKNAEVKELIGFLMIYGADPAAGLELISIDERDGISSSPNDAIVDVIVNNLTESTVQKSGAKLLEYNLVRRNAEGVDKLVEKGFDFSDGYHLKLALELATRPIQPLSHEIFGIVLKGKNVHLNPILFWAVDRMLQSPCRGSNFIMEEIFKSKNGMLLINSKIKELDVDYYKKPHLKNHGEKTLGELITSPELHIIASPELLISPSDLINRFKREQLDSTLLIPINSAGGCCKGLWDRFLTSEKEALDQLHNGKLPVTEQLEKWVDHEQNSLLHKAISIGYLTLAEELLRRYPHWDINQFNRYGETPLTGLIRKFPAKAAPLLRAMKNTPCPLVESAHSIISSFSETKCEKSRQGMEETLKELISGRFGLINLQKSKTVDLVSSCYLADISLTGPLANLLQVYEVVPEMRSLEMILKHLSDHLTLIKKSGGKFLVDLAILIRSTGSRKVNQKVENSIISILKSSQDKFPELKPLGVFFKAPSLLTELLASFSQNVHRSTSYRFIVQQAPDSMVIIKRELSPCDFIELSCPPKELESFFKAQMTEHIKHSADMESAKYPSSARNCALYKIELKDNKLIVSQLNKLFHTVELDENNPASWLDKFREVVQKMEKGQKLYNAYSRSSPSSRNSYSNCTLDPLRGYSIVKGNTSIEKSELFKKIFYNQKTGDFFFMAGIAQNQIAMNGKNAYVNCMFGSQKSVKKTIFFWDLTETIVNFEKQPISNLAPEQMNEWCKNDLPFLAPIFSHIYDKDKDQLNKSSFSRINFADQTLTFGVYLPTYIGLLNTRLDFFQTRIELPNIPFKKLKEIFDFVQKLPKPFAWRAVELNFETKMPNMPGLIKASYKMLKESRRLALKRHHQQQQFLPQPQAQAIGQLQPGIRHQGPAQQQPQLLQQQPQQQPQPQIQPLMQPLQPRNLLSSLRPFQPLNLPPLMQPHQLQQQPFANLRQPRIYIRPGAVHEEQLQSMRNRLEIEMLVDSTKVSDVNWMNEYLAASLAVCLFYKYNCLRESEDSADHYLIQEFDRYAMELGCAQTLSNPDLQQKWSELLDLYKEEKLYLNSLNNECSDEMPSIMKILNQQNAPSNRSKRSFVQMQNSSSPQPRTSEIISKYQSLEKKIQEHHASTKQKLDGLREKIANKEKALTLDLNEHLKWYDIRGEKISLSVDGVFNVMKGLRLVEEIPSNYSLSRK